MTNRWVRWLMLFLAASPALIPLMLIHDFGVDIPYWDQWDHDFAGIYVKAHQHQLSPADFVAQHNEHRPLVPRLVYFALNSVTHWNVIGELNFQWLVVLATSMGILWLDCVNSRQPVFDSRALFSWFLVNLLVFSPMQLEIWLWGMGLTNVLPMFFMVAALVTARSRLGQWPQTIIMIVMCSAATFSAGTGALSWGVIGVVLVWSNSWEQLKAKRWMLVAMASALFANVALYLIGFHRDLGATGQYLPASAGAFLDFVLLFLGSNFRFGTTFSTHINAIVTAILMLLMLVGGAAFLIVLWRRRRDDPLSGQVALWLAVAMFVVASALLGASARAGQGSSPAFQTRYIAYSIYLPLALIYLVRIIAGDQLRKFRFVPPVLATLLVIGWVQGIPMSFSQGAVAYRERCVTKASVMLVKVLPDNPQLAATVFPRPQVVRELAPVLNEMHYLRPPLIESPKVKRLNPGLEPGKPAAGMLERGWQASDTSFAISGWAVFPDLKRGADVVLICYDDPQGEPIIFGVTPVGGERKDVAAAMNNDAVRLCGWTAEIPVAGQFAGSSTITITAWALNVTTGKAYPLEGAATIKR